MINQVFGGYIEFGTKTLMTIQTKIICTVINHLDDNDDTLTYLLENKYPWVWSDPGASPTLAALVKRVDYKTSKRAVCGKNTQRLNIKKTTGLRINFIQINHNQQNTNPL